MVKFEFSTSETVMPLDEQMKDSSSMYHHYRNLIRFRRTSEVMTFGTSEPKDLSDNELMGFVRQHGEEELLIIHNLSADTKRMSEPAGFVNTVFSTYPMKNDPKDGLVLPAYQSIILSKKP